MKYREFVRWCNERAFDGCWGMLEAMACIWVLADDAPPQTLSPCS